MGSGPARVALNPKGTYKAIHYQDSSEIAIIALEAETLLT